MVVFLASTLNPSGLETAAAVSFTAGLAGVLRDGPPRRTAWPALVAGGVLLAATRSLGPYFVVALGVLFAVAFGTRPTWTRLAKARIPVAVAAVTIVAAMVANVAWEQTQQPHLSWSPSLLGHLSLTTVPRLVSELRFGCMCTAGTNWPTESESVRSPSASTHECVGVARTLRRNFEISRVVSRVPPYRSRS